VKRRDFGAGSDLKNKSDRRNLCSDNGNTDNGNTADGTVILETGIQSRNESERKKRREKVR
jgi:hypothetical protein